MIFRCRENEIDGGATPVFWFILGSTAGFRSGRLVKVAQDALGAGGKDGMILRFVPLHSIITVCLDVEEFPVLKEQVDTSQLKEDDEAYKSIVLVHNRIEWGVEFI